MLLVMKECKIHAGMPESNDWPGRRAGVSTRRAVTTAATLRSAAASRDTTNVIVCGLPFGHPGLTAV